MWYFIGALSVNELPHVTQILPDEDRITEYTSES